MLVRLMDMKNHRPYILAEVIYGDPNLAIQPSMQVHVHGKVVDTLRSDMGPQELVVEADRIDLPHG